MGDKRYQVFISSTYTDLQAERGRVMQSVLALNCIPAGMELFPAFDEQQLSFIKSIIDDCDYYVIIIGGRYGSVDAEGVSFTEREYDYALERGLKVLAFLHADPEEIALGKSERDPEGQRKLAVFKERVRTGRLVKEWQTPSDLAESLVISLTNTMRAYPARGWIRGDTAAGADILNQVNELRIQNDSLKKELSKLVTSKSDLISGGDAITFRYMDNYLNWSTGKLSCDLLFALIAPKLMVPMSDEYAKKMVTAEIKSVLQAQYSGFAVADSDLDTIKFHFHALGLFVVYPAKSVGGSQYVYWGLTERGTNYLIQIRALKKQAST